MIHKHPIRVYYEDTDAGGIVYHASHIRFAERGRTEFLRTVGWTNSQIAKELDTLFVVRHIEADYHKPAFLDDLLEMRTHVSKVKNSSFIMRQELYRGDVMLCGINVVIACISHEGNLVKIPEKLRNTLQDNLVDEQGK